jgi:hypothetical protein
MRPARCTKTGRIGCMGRSGQRDVAHVRYAHCCVESAGATIGECSTAAQVGDACDGAIFAATTQRRRRTQTAAPVAWGMRAGLTRRSFRALARIVAVVGERHTDLYQADYAQVLVPAIITPSCTGDVYLWLASRPLVSSESTALRTRRTLYWSHPHTNLQLSACFDFTVDEAGRPNHVRGL